MNSSPSWTRRDVLATTAAGSAAAAIVGIIPRSLRGMASRRGTVVGAPDPITVIDSTDVRALAHKALEAAKAAGASYADVRLTRLLTQNCHAYGVVGVSLPMYTTEHLGIGVRARFQGAWGFAGSPYWEPDEVVQLAREAVAQAKVNARLVSQEVEWTPIPVASGSWKTPVKADPFLVTIEEKGDLLATWGTRVARYGGLNAGEVMANFSREERAVATTEGSYFTQTLYVTSGLIRLSRRDRHLDHTEPTVDVGVNAPGGWELITELDYPTKLPAVYASAAHRAGEMTNVAKPGDIGRYEVVFDGATMAALLDQTLGVATQVDRALGYEANAGGTSFLGPDPLALLGTHQTAAPIVTVTANRSAPTGFATVKWDDEGVEPEPFTLIKDGVLVDYQTTRDQAGWLAPYYQKKGIPVRSHGCAAAQDATFITTQHTPNLVLEPSIFDADFNTLVADTKRGLAVTGGLVTTDFQGRTGMGVGTMQEIVNGRLGATVQGLSFSFNTQQLWKNVVALGGAKSAVEGGQWPSSKGEPAQNTIHGVRAVPAKVINVDFVDPRRGA